MIEQYIVKLIDNLPDEITKSEKPVEIDLILDGGVFNGSYLTGAVLFLKEMEKRKYIKIKRISGCSIGSLVGFLYFIDSLDLMYTVYDTFLNQFKKTYTLSDYMDMKKYLSGRITNENENDICNKINHKLFINYNNIKKGTRPFKCVYKNVDEIINTIIRSSFVPYLINGDIVYENKYIDGFSPYIFKKRSNRKILFIDLFGIDKLGYMLNIKNEKINHHRILSGVLDVHNFFIKQSETSMCSYINDWGYFNKLRFNFKLLIEKIVCYIVYLITLFKKYSANHFNNNIFYKILSKISYDTFIILLETYCL